MGPATSRRGPEEPLIPPVDTLVRLGPGVREAVLDVSQRVERIGPDGLEEPRPAVARRAEPQQFPPNLTKVEALEAGTHPRTVPAEDHLLDLPRIANPIAEPRARMRANPDNDVGHVPHIVALGQAQVQFPVLRRRQAVVESSDRLDRRRTHHRVGRRAGERVLLPEERSLHLPPEPRPMGPQLPSARIDSHEPAIDKPERRGALLEPRQLAL